MNIEKIYKQMADGDNSILLNLKIEDFYTCMLDFDPVTNDSLYSNLDELLYKISKYDFSDKSWFNDRFQNIVAFSEKAIYQIIDLLHEKNIREHKITNPNMVKDIDTQCMMWLSKKPGFNIKQKIAADQKMMGVFHKTSIDTAENRLFKAFLIKIDDIFVEKEKVLKKYRSIKDNNDSIGDIEQLISKVHRWLYSEEAQLISNWNNVPPNNTLLNDRNYRKIWKSWIFLQHINEETESDFNRKNDLLSEIAFVLLLSKLNCDNRFQLKQDIVCPNYHVNKDSKLTFFSGNNPIIKGYYLNNNQYNKLTLTLNNNLIKIQINNEIKDQLDVTSKSIDSFSQINDTINTFLKKIFGEIKNNRIVDDQKFKIKENSISAIDINSVLPEYMVINKEVKKFSEQLICQSVIDKKYNLPCNLSKYIETTNNNYQTYSIHNVFDYELQKELYENKDFLIRFESASNTFSQTVARVLNTNKCVYLVPDNIDDFSPVVNIFKRSVNSQFEKTLLLPRSVAAIFSNYETILSNVDKESKLKIEDFYDSYRIEINYRIVEDKTLKKILPKTKGLVFERTSVKTVTDNIKINSVVPEKLRNIISSSDINSLKGKFSIDNFHCNAIADKQNNIGIFINNKQVKSIVKGALNLYTLQKEVNLKNNTENIISLWRDYLPPLSMELENKHEFVLVGKNVSINPFSTVSEKIPISVPFLLPENKDFYEFPLIQGEGKEQSKYFAYIKDSSFPLKDSVKCKLNLTYTYGAPLPYNLEFIPIHKASFKSVTVSWETKSHIDLIHLDYPKYPEKKTWEDMENFLSDKGDIIDFIGDWIPEEIDKIKNKGYFFNCTDITELRNGNFLYFCKNEKKDETVACYIRKDIHEKIIEKEFDCENTIIWCYLNESKKYPGKYQGDYPLVVTPNIRGQKYKFSRLRMAVKTVWKDSRSISDEDCPGMFRRKVKGFITYLSKQLDSDIPDKIKNEYRVILFCLSKDVPQEEIENYVREYLIINENNPTVYTNLGYVLDTVDLYWQQDLLNNILLWFEDKKKFKNAIPILAIASWQNPDFIHKIPKDRISSIIRSILKVVSSFVKKFNKKNSLYGITSETLFNDKYKNLQDLDVSYSLELLLALLRLRENSDDETCKILSPFYNEDLKNLSRVLPDLEKIVNKNKLEMKSFLNFEFDRTKNTKNLPDILYVADIYINGNIESKSIKILNNSMDED